MMLIFFILFPVFQSSASCLDDPDDYYNYISSTRVNEGESLKIECYTSGDSYLPIKWSRQPRRGNFTLPNGESSCECGNVLEFPSITKDQRGGYICGTNSILGSASRYVKVNVNFIPVILEIRRVDFFETKELELRCNGEAHPSPDIIWTKDNVILYTNKQHQVITKYDCDDVYNSTLIISTEFDYYGTYRCRFQNEMGQTTMTFKVTAPALKINLVSDYDGGKGP